MDEQDQPSNAARQGEMPSALVAGQPVVELPQDLYIPPDALEVILEAFEGPLDLLLYLIRRQNMDILDIDVSEITRQYINYITFIEAMRFELAAEYLVMAATLAEIKSRMLLPRQESETEEEPDPRAELIRRLQQYERYKQAAEDLDGLPRQDRDFYPAGIEPPPLEKQRPRPDVQLSCFMPCGTCSTAPTFSSITRWPGKNSRPGSACPRYWPGSRGSPSSLSLLCSIPGKGVWAWW